MIENNTPFAMMCYHESFIMDKSSSVKKYELITVSINNQLSLQDLQRDEINYLKNHNELIKVIDNADGVVWEFNNFKDYYSKLKPKKRKSKLFKKTRLKSKQDENNTNSTDKEMVE